VANKGPAAQFSVPGALRLLPPLTEERSPLAVLNSPPLTEEERPLAVLFSPPLTEARRALAVLNRPPLTEERAALAVLSNPPLTEDPAPLASFLSPPLTTDRVALAMLRAPPLTVAARKHNQPGSQTCAAVGSDSVTLSGCAGSQYLPMGSHSLPRARTHRRRLTLPKNGHFAAGRGLHFAQ
jgi:hypothetical protein